jgi:hypothetical protein
MWRLYAPALVLLCWAAIIGLFGASRYVAVVALVTVAVSMVGHARETLARSRDRRRHRVA